MANIWSVHASPAAKYTRVLVNAHDRTINAEAAVALAARWDVRGARVGIYQLYNSLRLPHDFIDAAEVGGRCLPITAQRKPC